ncbi:MAG TPA: hypothetical protein VED37_17500 [Ktedonobacteraceae bacterium]|nr:hypothetical protein [Ktedonobacteraceae bacterium]
MELSLRLDTLGLVEVRYLRSRERFRDWPPFLFVAASRQARILAYMNRDVVEQLHRQILAVEEAAGLGSDDEDDDDVDKEVEETGESKDILSGERDNTALSPAFAQALEKLNDLARQRLPEPGTNVDSAIEEDLAVNEEITLEDEEDALEQLQEAFVQMMEVVRELAEELSTDALKLTGRFRCARIDVFFTQTEPEEASVEDGDHSVDIEIEEGLGIEENLLQVELALVLRLYEEGHAKSDDLPAVELQLDVDDFVHLHESVDFAFDKERRSSRRRR